MNDYYSLKMLATGNFPLQNGGTPLLYAVHGNHGKCVKMLLGKQVNVVWKKCCECFKLPLLGGAYIL